MEGFDVKINNEYGNYYLSVTHNGYQWSSIQFNDSREIQKAIVVLIAQVKAIKEAK